MSKLTNFKIHPQTAAKMRDRAEEMGITLGALAEIITRQLNESLRRTLGNEVFTWAESRPIAKSRAGKPTTSLAVPRTAAEPIYAWGRALGVSTGDLFEAWAERSLPLLERWVYARNVNELPIELRGPARDALRGVKEEPYE